MNSKPIVLGKRPFMYIEYKYNYTKVLVLLIRRGLLLMIYMAPISLAFLRIIIMFKFYLLFVILYLVGILMYVIP